MKSKQIIIIVLIMSFAEMLANESKMLDIMQSELDRSMTTLQKEELPPYFISYHVTEIEQEQIRASFGKIESVTKDNGRTLDIDLRVGDYRFDNTHIIRGNPFNFGGGRSSAELPVENNEAAIRNAIWYATDNYYKDAIERYEKALTNKAVKVEEEDNSADFSREKPNIEIIDKVSLKIDTEYWKSVLREASAVFLSEPWLYDGGISLQAAAANKYFINTEGSKLQWPETYYRVFISASTKADDGMSLPLYKSFFGFSAEELPDLAELKTEVQKIINLLKEMREAALVTTYSGPAILSGEASGVFFHEIFGHRVEGHRLKDPNNAQTFKHSIGEEVLPTFMDVIFDPEIKELDKRPLSGYYKFDDEGVKGQKVRVVENGIFKDFLMSRSPIENFSNSNGHGRKQAGRAVCSRQSNLIVSSDKSVSFEELKDQLRELCKEEDKEYGLYFLKVQGGFTFTGRSIPNSFNVTPVVVYKIFADGSPDELVRGVDLIGTPLTTFSNIIATADDLGIFNGMCGAESGSIPVSACSPSLLVSKIEVQRKQKSQAKPPLLPAPTIEVTQ